VLFPQTPSSELIPSIDYLTFSLREVPWDYISQVKEYIEEFGKTNYLDNPEQGRKIGTWYPSHMANPHGGVITYRQDKQGLDIWDAVFTLPGSLCQRMGTGSIVHILSFAKGYGGKCSRIDINVDDYLRQIDYEPIATAAREGRYSRFSRCKIIEGFEKSGKREGWTIYIGSRTSDTMVRFYDAKPPHGIDATRYEVEYKSHTANAIANAITELETEESISEMLGGLLNGTLRILAEKKEHNTNRIGNAPFWESFSSRLATAYRFMVSRPESTINDTLHWIRTRVSKSLAMCKVYYAEHFESFLTDLLKDGVRSLGPVHLSKLRAAGRDGFLRFIYNDSYSIDFETDPDWWRDWMDPENCPPYLLPF
jgi:DNA relaxase NicK